MEYRIGDFAVITRLSVKTLRYYHEERLLEPSRIASDTGYRYYNGELIYIARIISTLRQWGFSIREIREILLEYSDDSDLVEIVQKKRTEITEKISKLKKIDEELSLLIKFEKEYAVDFDARFPGIIKHWLAHGDILKCGLAIMLQEAIEI